MRFQFAVQPLAVEARIQLDPEHEATLRPADPGAGRKITADPVDHLLQAAGVLAAHAPQVRLVVAGLEVFRQGQLRQLRGGAGAHVFHVQHAIEVAPGGDPADAQAGRQGLGKGTAEQHAPVFVIGLDAARTRVAVGQLAVDVVLDDRHVVALRQGEQGAFIGVRHDVAERVVAGRRQLDGLDRPLFEGQLQGLQADPGERVGGQFQRLHAEAFQRLHDPVEARRVDRNYVAGLAGRADRGG
ncbi:hypothetical protein D3C84_371640 [compost metagenome]